MLVVVVVVAVFVIVRETVTATMAAATTKRESKENNKQTGEYQQHMELELLNEIFQDYNRKTNIKNSYDLFRFLLNFL